MTEVNYKLVGEKEILRKHLSFIKEMLIKVKNTPYEAKWQRMCEMITNEKKMTPDQITKLDNTITNLKTNMKTKRTQNESLNHQPIVPIKAENTTENVVIKEPSRENSTSNIQKIITPIYESSNSFEPRQKSELDEKLIEIKKEKVPEKPQISQVEIETEHCDTSSDEEPIKARSTKTRAMQKRLFVDDSESEDVIRAPPKRKMMRRKSTKMILSDSSDNDETTKKENPTKERISKPLTSIEAKENDEKVLELKKLIEKLKKGETENPELLLNKFENIIGSSGFQTLKTLFVKTALLKDSARESSLESEKKTENSNKSASETDDQPKSELKEATNMTINNDSDALSSSKMEKLGGRKRKTEAEKLKEDVMEMFIRDGVLAATGLRKHRKIPYAEPANDINEDFNADSSCRDESLMSVDESASINCQKGSSSEEKETSPLLTESKSVSPVPLKELYVLAEKLNLKMNRTVKILSDGTLYQTSDESDNEINVIEPDLPKPTNLSEVATSSNISNSDTFPPVEELPQMIPIMISDDENEDNALGEVKPVLMSLLTASNSNNNDQEVITIDSDDDDLPNLKFLTSSVKKMKPKLETLALKTPSTPSKVLANVERLVCNLSFNKCRTGHNLKCNVEKCKFEAINELMFQYHIQTRHLLTKWSGSCELCKKSVSDYGSLLDEYNHMKAEHILKGEDEKEKLNDLDKNHIKLSINSQAAEESKRKRGRPKKTKLADEITSPSLVPPTLTNTTQSKPRVIVNVMSKISNIPVASVSPQMSKPQVIPREPKIILPKPSIPNVSTFAQTVHSPTQLVQVNQPGSFLMPSTIVPSQPLQTASQATKVQANNLSTNFMTQNPLQATQPEKQPQLKLRMLPGDKLSSTSTNHVAPQTNPISQTQPCLYNELILGAGNTRRLRPWLPGVDNKLSIRIDKMLKQKCLFEFFKCMDFDCDFHTSDSHDFTRHLLDHQVKSGTLIQLRCAYCAFSSQTPVELVLHMNHYHKYDKYACTKCFYRSVAELNVADHLKIYHKDHSNSIYECKNEKLSSKAAVEQAKETRKKFILPISCVCCKAKFFIFNHFVNHYNEQHSKENIRHRCNKCQKETNVQTLKYHLEQCHNIKQLHCMSCSFGSMSLESIKVHMMDVHPNKLPLFCERLGNGSQHPHSSIDSLQIKYIGLLKAELIKNIIENEMTLK